MTLETRWTVFLLFLFKFKSLNLFLFFVFLPKSYFELNLKKEHELSFILYTVYIFSSAIVDRSWHFACNWTKLVQNAVMTLMEAGSFGKLESYGILLESYESSKPGHVTQVICTSLDHICPVLWPQMTAVTQQNKSTVLCILWYHRFKCSKVNSHNA